MHRFVRLLLLTLLTLLLAAPAFAQSDGVSQSRFDRLMKGVSITRWFWYPEGVIPDDNHYQNYVSDAHLAEIRAAGFQHIRLPIEPADLINMENPSDLDRRLIGFLDRAIARMNAADLAVIVDPHVWEETLANAVITDPASTDAYVRMWSTLAAHLSTTNPEMVFLEVMNEPQVSDDSWLPIQGRIVEAMRASAPNHTIIVGGPHWNSIQGLVMLQPLPDPNIIYNFHFYEPFVFTHQGATWSGDMGVLRGIPYPSNHWNGCGNLPYYGDVMNGAVEDYCWTNPWDATVIDSAIREAYDWAQQYGVRLTVNEFGVMPTAPFHARMAWFRDVRASFENYGIGWSLWGYDDAFGLDYFLYEQMDAGVMQALGMF
jgi:hypothetical protein